MKGKGHVPSMPVQEPPQPLEDLMRPGLLAVFCGLNPGLQAAMTGHHFEGHANRFWRAMHLAGFTDHELRPVEDHSFLSYGFGLATAVTRPTAGADELSQAEYANASVRLMTKLERFRPAYIAFLGKAAYAAMTSQRVIEWGPQAQPMGGTKVWVLPNPSGRNRGFSLPGLVESYSEFRRCVQRERGEGDSLALFGDQHSPRLHVG